MINRPLLEDTLAHICGLPELHSQSFFYEVNEYGLAACYAGRSLLLSGYEAALTSVREGATSCLAIEPYTRERVNVWEEAREVLGIDRQWATNLFTPVNTRYMLERKVKDLLNGSPLDRYYELLSERS